jgi:acetyltransferase-like isoleucine patch superfamily enzyme
MCLILKCQFQVTCFCYRVLLCSSKLKCESIPVGSFLWLREFWCRNLINASLGNQLQSTLLHDCPAGVLRFVFNFVIGHKSALGNKISEFELPPAYITIGEEAFIASDVVFASHLKAGQFRLEPIVIGDGAFVGNRAAISGGSTLPQSCLIGSMTEMNKENTSQVKYNYLICYHIVQFI